MTASDKVLSSSETPKILRTKSSVFGVEISVESFVVSTLSTAMVVSDLTPDVSVVTSSVSTVTFSDSKKQQNNGVFPSKYGTMN